MSPKPISIAFVSGKGGVGKTMLAANFAWVCCQNAKTMLVDLDFQNQGCTGLFAPHVEFTKSNALEAIKNPGNYTSKELIQVADKLYFLPAVCWQQRPSQKEISSYVNADDFQQKLEIFIIQLRQKQAFEIVVLDCHGGVDAVSWSAFQSCDYTLMVTEADSVTFAGTLELLNYYEIKAPKIDSKVPPDNSPSQARPATSNIDSTESSPCVKFIVNRLPSKYKWADLEQIYQSYISKKLGTFTTDRSVFCYIPSEDLVADSFGEYPFHAELAPKSIFAKKIHYMAYSLLNVEYDLALDYKPLRKLQKSRYKKKIERTVVSNEFKNISSILKGFIGASVFYVVFLVVLLQDLLIGSTKSTIGSKILLSVLMAAFVPSLWYITQANLGLKRLCKDKYKFRKRLFQAVSAKLTLWRRIILLKLLILRIVTTIGAYIISVSLVFAIVTITIGIVGYLFDEINF